MKPMPTANDRPVATVISAWAEERGLRPGTLSRRLLKGWSVEEALTRPVEPRRPSGEWKRDPNAATRGRKGVSRFVPPGRETLGGTLRGASPWRRASYG